MYQVTKTIKKVSPICKNGLKSTSSLYINTNSMPIRNYANANPSNIASTTFANTPMGVFSDQLFLQPINPATIKPITDLRVDNKNVLKKKFDRAYLKKNEWKNVPLEEKKNMIIKFRDLLIANTNRVSEDLTKETGKPISQAKNEVLAVIDRIEFFLNNTEKVLAEQVVRTTDKFQEKLVKEPLGIIANISAWNYPIFIGLNVIIPALLTGNCVLYKPSEYSSLTGLNIMTLLYEAGIPEEVFQVVLGKSVIAQSLLNLPIDGVFFTGSYATGQKISQTLAGRMVKTQLELGGKDAVYVHSSADLATAIASIADGAMYNNGQSCCSVERIYVDKSIYNTFVNELVEVIKRFKFSFDPMNPKTYFGPLTRGLAQVEHLQKLIGSALKRGAILELGGNVIEDAPGYFFAPTVISNVHHGMDIQREEIFGPVVTVQPVSGPTEAALLMNDTPFGLTGSVYSQDPHVANYIAEASNTGTVYWNSCDRVSPYLPWSGRGHSGVGTTLGMEGIECFTKPKALHLFGPTHGYFGEAKNSDIVPTKPASLVELLKNKQEEKIDYEDKFESPLAPVYNFNTMDLGYPLENESLFVPDNQNDRESFVKSKLQSGAIRKANTKNYIPVNSVKDTDN
ncbi:hypothetical protein RB653_002677 [Dictyostelium firmibasis]|uniref:Aldehyde dehydrogenase domain-containing protein n=1 Tax=Dictyostelium firmibasis TaxID=79012 RepID=A0AAN7YYW0_9MYCE